MAFILRYRKYLIMTIEKAMQRIGWRLGTGKPFQPNQGDIDAYNFIVEFVDKKQKQQLKFVCS